MALLKRTGRTTTPWMTLLFRVAAASCGVSPMLASTAMGVVVSAAAAFRPCQQQQRASRRQYHDDARRRCRLHHDHHHPRRLHSVGGGGGITVAAARRGGGTTTTTRRWVTATAGGTRTRKGGVSSHGSSSSSCLGCSAVTPDDIPWGRSLLPSLTPPTKAASGGNDDDDDDDHDDDDDSPFSEVVDEFGCAAYESYYYEEGLDHNERECRWIRVEKQRDECLDSIRTREDVVRKIAQVRQEQSRYGRADLYSRDWEVVGGGPLDQFVYGDKKNRIDEVNGAEEPKIDGFNEDYNIVNGDAAKERSNVISVMQLNTLAEGLSAGPDAKTPFRIARPSGSSGSSKKKQKQKQKQKEQDYGGFTSVPFPHVCLDFSQRRWRLLETILGPDRSAPCDLDVPFDLIALEEVDRFRGFFAPVLRLFGYEGIFMPKTRSPGISMGWYSDGCCLFWKKSAFDLISERRIKYRVGNQGLMIVVLGHRASGKAVVVAVTHLKAQKSSDNERIRCGQVDEMLERIDDTTVKIATKRDNNDNNVDPDQIPVLILGDFNADPPSQSVPGTESSVDRVLRYERRHRRRHHGNTPAAIAPPSSPSSSSSSCGDGGVGKRYYRSAYEVDPPPDNFYTTWKTRGNSTLKRIIDYIFYSDNSLQCNEILPIPSAEELEESKLPGLRNPSDHLLIAAKFQIE